MGLPGEFRRAVLVGLGVFAVLLGMNWTNEWLFGPFALHATPLKDPNGFGISNHFRVHGVIVALISFLLATQFYERRRLPADLLRLEPLAASMPGGFHAFVQAETAMPKRALWVALVGGAVVGAATYYGSVSESVSIIRDDQLAHLLWALGSNAILFVTMIHSGQRTWMAHRAVVHTVDRIESIPLLDRAALAPFAQIGIRHSFYWVTGSSIASLLALDLARRGPLVILLAATLAVATAALFGPARTIHARIRAAKEAELARVRERIGAAREAALAAGSGHAEAGATALPGLLAWEARVADVPEWPFDPSTWLRFGALVVLATGSWLGGAVVERALGAVLD